MKSVNSVLASDPHTPGVRYGFHFRGRDIVLSVLQDLVNLGFGSEKGNEQTNKQQQKRGKKTRFFTARKSDVRLWKPVWGRIGNGGFKLHVP